MAELKTNFTNQIGWRCMNCVSCPSEVEGIKFLKKSVMTYESKCEAIADLRDEFPCFLKVDRPSEKSREFVTGNSQNHVNDCWNSNDDLEPVDRFGDDCIVESLPKDMACANFVRKMDKANMKPYWELDKYLRSTVVGSMDVERLILNFAKIAYPSHSKCFYGGIWDTGKHAGKIKYNWSKSGYEFHHDSKVDSRRFSRHRYVLALIVKRLLLKYFGKNAKKRTKVLMSMMGADKSSIACSVFHYLSKGSDEVKLPEAESLTKLFSDNYASDEDWYTHRKDDPEGDISFNEAYADIMSSNDDD